MVKKSLFKQHQYSIQHIRRSHQGFTLLEIVVVVAIIGILGAIVVPGWMSFLERWRLTDAQAELYSAIRHTQTKAHTNAINWQFSIREASSGRIEWAIHPQASQPQTWETIGHHSIDIDLANTTLTKKNGAYYIRFDYKGRLASRRSTLTLTSHEGGSRKRCIVMSTLLGAMRKGQEQRRPNSSGRYCY